MDFIKFGTDGWRAKMSETFTIPNVRRAAYGLGLTLRKKKKSSSVFIGYDTMLHSRQYAEAVARVLSALGHRVTLASRLLPTPALSLAVKEKKADAGVMITASHNSGAYNGFKIKLPPGVSAPTEFTKRVEKNIPAATADDPAKRVIAKADWLPFYLKSIRSKVNLPLLRRSGLKVVVDSMHGVGARHFEGIVSGGRTKVVTVAAERDDDFGGRQPEPIGPNLKPLTQTIRKLKANLGLATDGDGDRVGMMDENGRFVDVHKIHALLLYHLWINRGLRGAVVKTVSGTLMVERMARRWGIPLFETPIGFKHIGAVMLKEDVLLGLEESGGIAFKGHLPERDGLLSALYILEALVTMKKSATQAVDFLQKEFGPYRFDRIDLKNISFDRQDRILTRLKKSPPAKIGSRKVTGVQTLDGVKFKMEDAWLILRASGTEPLLRLYAEAPTTVEVKTLLNAAKKMAVS